MRTRISIFQERAWIRELLIFAPIYFFLSLISLRDKLYVTSTWFDGTLEQNHLQLLQFNYTNNEQSRLLQFYIPELLHRVFALNVQDAYIVQRWLFIFVAFICFHFYLKKWFALPGRFAGVLFLAAVLPLASLDDLQESSPLLLLTFLLALWAIREDNLPTLILVSIIGGLNNETMLAIPLVYFFFHFKSMRRDDLVIWLRDTILVNLPLVLIVGTIRYMTRDRPVLEDAWHLPDNLQGILNKKILNPLRWYDSTYWYPLFIYGAFWFYAIASYRKQPLFLRRASLMVPFFVVGHLITGITSEVRQMLPLSGILIPMGLFAICSGKPDSDSAILVRTIETTSAD